MVHNCNSNRYYLYPFYIGQCCRRSRNIIENTKDTLERVINEIDITVKGIVTPRYGFLNVAK